MNLDVTTEEAQLIVNGLAELPAKLSFGLLSKLLPQIQLQLQLQARPAPAPETPE
jgi:hypothetical protein